MITRLPFLLKFIFLVCVICAAASFVEAQDRFFDGKSPISTSVLVTRALRDGFLPLSGGFAPPAGGPLPNIQASEGGSPVNEDPIMVNPNNPQQMLTGGNDFNCPNSQGFYSSNNAGRTWSHYCKLTTSGHVGEGDPGVGYDLNGNSYIGGVDGGSSDAVVIQKSSDNGATWSAPNVAVLPLFSGGLPDKDWLQIDINPSSPHANSLYISVTQLDANDSQITVSHSTDGGRTWTMVPVDSKQTYPEGDQFRDLAIGKDGTVYVSWMHCTGNGPAGDCGDTLASMMFSKSTDGRNTWSAPVVMAQVTLAPDTCGAYWGCLPNTNERVSNIPAIDIDNSNGSHKGTLYAVMYNWTGSKMQVGVVRSANGGSTWSAFVPVSPASSGDQFFPWLSVSSAGVVGATWLDRRDDPNNLEYITYATGSTNGGASFVASKRIGTAPSNPNNDGQGGFFMGDYTGNYWATATNLVSSWMDSRNGVNMQDEVGGFRLK